MSPSKSCTDFFDSIRTWTLKRPLGHEGEALMNGISIKRGQRICLLFLSYKDIRSWESATERDPSPAPDHDGTPISDFRSPEHEEQMSTVYKSSSLQCFVTVVQSD